MLSNKFVSTLKAAQVFAVFAELLHRGVFCRYRVQVQWQNVRTV